MPYIYEKLNPVGLTHVMIEIHSKFNTMAAATAPPAAAVMATAEEGG